MLERVAAQVANSTYGLAVNESELLSQHYSGGIRFYVNAIVTTASLQLCTFDPGDIDIATGDLGEEATFEEVPFIRFRKQLGALPQKELPKISDIRQREYSICHQLTASRRLLVGFQDLCHACTAMEMILANIQIQKTGAAVIGYAFATSRF
jgi:hypothetical protein